MNIFRLDLMGGIAGDMFVASVLHAFPEFENAILADLAKVLPSHVSCSFRRQINGGISGLKFAVEITNHAESVHSLSFSEIEHIVNESKLPSEVIYRALNIFRHLARVESIVHGVPIRDVHFHEISDWDSVADIVASAWLIEKLKDEARWVCSSIPLGSGKVKTAHGRLTIPAPATLELLKGMPVHSDRIRGERVTPTGAAIIRELQPEFNWVTKSAKTIRVGYGVGTRVLHGVPNVLRFVQFLEERQDFDEDCVVSVSFNVDDQTPEEISVALEQLRSIEGVHDVLQNIAYGKKGRIVFAIDVIAMVSCFDELVKSIFSKTTTIGLRYQYVGRRILSRAFDSVFEEGKCVSVKTVIRPSGWMSVKAESDDVVGETLRQRRYIRANAESAVLRKKVYDNK